MSTEAIAAAVAAAAAIFIPIEDQTDDELHQYEISFEYLPDEDQQVERSTFYGRTTTTSWKSTFAMLWSYCLFILALATFLILLLETLLYVSMVLYVVFFDMPLFDDGFDESQTNSFV